MDVALTLLAVVGFAAVTFRLVRSGFGALRWGVDAFAAGERARTRARRGDLTGMAEAEQQIVRAGRGRRRAAGAVALWAAFLVLPPLTPWPRDLYAVYGAVAALLWGARSVARGSEPGNPSGGPSG